MPFLPREAQRTGEGDRDAKRRGGGGAGPGPRRPPGTPLLRRDAPSVTRRCAASATSPAARGRSERWSGRGPRRTPHRPERRAVRELDLARHLEAEALVDRDVGVLAGLQVG